MQLRTSLTVLALFASACVTVHATPADYAPLMRAEKFAEVERLANAKLAQDPANSDALFAKAEAILAGAPDRFEEAAKLGEQCVAAHPQQSECHEIYGNALGTKAMHGGLMAAMGYVGKIKDSFKKAVELNPNNLGARFSLLQFYLQAPGIAGGSSSKAQTVADETVKINADAAKVMQALIELSDDKLAKAESSVVAAHAGKDDVVIDNQRSVWVNLGTKYLQDKKPADAERVFQQLQQRFPESEWGPYGLARVQQDLGKHQAALALLDKASSLAPNPRARIYYRVAQSLQALNDKQKALASYEKALATKPSMGKQQTEDVQKQIKALKSA
jgi:tetratricopeptide (TPR) repeat protein